MSQRVSVVLGSGSVGPEAIAAGSSPGMSEITSVTTRAGRGRGGQPAALDRRQMLADDVHLGDGRAAGAAAPVDRLLVGERHVAGRQRHQRRAAAGDQRDHQIVRASPRTAASISRAARSLAASGTGCAASRISMRPAERRSRSGSRRARQIHVRPGASSPAAMAAEALPAPTTMQRPFGLSGRSAHGAAGPPGDRRVEDAPQRRARPRSVQVEVIVAPPFR